MEGILIRVPAVFFTCAARLHGRAKQLENVCAVLAFRATWPLAAMR
jgi:hypothetical protein